MKTDTEKTQHTPGPWVTDGNTKISNMEPNHCQVKAFHEGDSEPIKLVCSAYYGTSDAERAANARLIAAAPELLAALEELLKYTLHLTDKRQNLETKAARAAIAKAKGEA